MSKANIKSQCINGKPVNVYEDAFAEFLGIIRPEILKGKAYNMNYLLQLYKDMLMKSDQAKAQIMSKVRLQRQSCVSPTAWEHKARNCLL